MIEFTLTCGTRIAFIGDFRICELEKKKGSSSRSSILYIPEGVSWELRDEYQSVVDKIEEETQEYEIVEQSISEDVNER